MTLDYYILAKHMNVDINYGYCDNYTFDRTFKKKNLLFNRLIVYEVTTEKTLQNSTILFLDYIRKSKKSKF